MRRAPVRFVYRNLVWNAAGEVRACYRLESTSYEGLTAQGKLDLAAAFGEFAMAVERDFQLLRVTRTWSVDGYLEQAERLVGPTGHPEQWRAYLEQHRRALAGREVARPEVYVSVRLNGRADETNGTTARGFGAELRGAVRAAAGAFGLGSPLALSERHLSGLLSEQRMVLDELEMLAAEPASVAEIEWLVRRSFTRGVGEPEVEGAFAPQAVIVEEDGGEARWEPLEVDVLRWVDSEIDRSDPACLRVTGECGESHQALLALGALQAAVPFPSPRAELLFHPLENAGFPVDACLSVRHLPNEHARRLVRTRRLVAEHVLDAEHDGGFGTSAEAEARPRLAQALGDYLDSDAHPPLFMGAITLAVGAPSREELEARVAALRRVYKPVQVHRPRGAQTRVFRGMFPGQPPVAAGYEDVFYPEQLGSLVPTATYHAGSARGVYVGHTLSASSQPVLWDCQEASRRGLPGAILFLGTLGGGKSVSAQGAFVYPEVLRGSQVILADPKGDNHLPAFLRARGLDHVIEEVELPGEQERRGLLDPLRIAPEGMEADLAADFLLGLFREPNDDRATEIQTAIHDVVRAARASGRRGTCGEVIVRLDELGSEHAARAARHLRAVSASGLAGLGFADERTQIREFGAAQVTVFRLRNLTLPPAGSSPEQFTPAQRLSRQVLHLVATYALSVMGRPGVHKVFCSDEAGILLDDDQGRRVLTQAARWGRGESLTLLLLTQIVRDVAGLENLLGAQFVFHTKADADQATALAGLGLDPDDPTMRARLGRYRAGRCLMRDYDGQVAPIQLDLVDPELEAALDTTPEHLRTREDENVAAA